MKPGTLFFMAVILVSSNTYSKTIKLRNTQTGQTMSVFCFNANSKQCQYKLEEAKSRLQEGTNQEASTLTGARVEDSVNQSATYIGDNAAALRDAVSRGAESTGDAVARGLVSTRDAVARGAESTRDAVSRGAETAGNNLSAGADSASDLLSRGANNTRDALANAADRTKNAVSNGIDQLKGKTYRVRIPGHEQSMTFHCFGGLESKECKQDQEETVAAIKQGSESSSLEDYRMSPLYKAGDAITGAAVVVGDNVNNALNFLDHKSCKAKLERHARDFDESYSLNGSELTSYEVKMDYVLEKLTEEGRLDDCQEHYDNAVLGYQLDWVTRGRVSQVRTHIFDGVGRLANGNMGYWKNEERPSNNSNAAQR
jgi:hypothetical protein